MQRSFWFLVLLLLGGCGRPTATLSDDQFDANAPGDSLHAVRIPVDGEFWGGYPVLSVDDRIFVRNPYQSEYGYSVYLFSGDSLKKEGEFIHRGRGPLEMQFSELSYDSITRQINMLSYFNKENRFCRVRVDKPDDLYDLSKWFFSPLPYISRNEFFASCLIEGSTYLMLGYSGSSLEMFSLLDIDKEQVVPLDFRYPSIPIELEPIFQSMFWAGGLYKCPGKNRFLYSAQDFRYMFIFDLDAENKIHIVRNITNNLPNVHPSSESGHPFSFDDSCEDGSVNIAVDDNLIYVGYGHKTYGQMREAAKARKSFTMFRPRRINVYDWDGNFVRRLILDKAIGPMVITENQIVAVHTDPETAEECFVRYSL